MLHTPNDGRMNTDRMNTDRMNDDSVQPHARIATPLRRIFTEQGAPLAYPPAKTLAWLRWLATQMEQRHLISITADDLSSERLASAAEKERHHRLAGLLFGAIYGVLTGLARGPVGGVSGGVTVGLLFGLLAGWVGWHSARFEHSESLYFSGKRGLVAGTGIGLAYGLFFTLGPGMGMGVMFGLFAGLLGALVGGVRHTAPPDADSVAAVTNLRTARLVGGICLGLLSGFAGGLLAALLLGLLLGLMGGLIVAVLFSWQVSQRAAGAGPRFLPLLSFGRGVRFGLRTVPWGIVIVGGIAWALFGVWFGLLFGVVASLAGGLIVGLIGSLLGALWQNVQRTVLQRMLERSGSAPWRYARFLEHAAQMGLLEKHDSRYTFPPHLPPQQVAALTDADIARICASVR